MFGKIQCMKEKVQFVDFDATFFFNPNTNDNKTKNTGNVPLVHLGKNYFQASPKSDQILGDHKNKKYFRAKYLGNFNT